MSAKTNGKQSRLRRLAWIVLPVALAAYGYGDNWFRAKPAIDFSAPVAGWEMG